MAKNLATYNPEDEAFWQSEGKRIATRNLWISIPCLLCGFAVWLYWGIITVQMINLGFPFTQGELFTLAAIAGLTGATLRIPSSFFISIAGGMRWVRPNVAAKPPARWTAINFRMFLDRTYITGRAR